MKYVLASAAIAMFMVGCGGGGSGSGTTPTTVTTLAPVTLAPAGLVTVSGKVTFDFVPVTVTGITPKLDYTRITAKPARSISVALINSATGDELATAKTDANGDYSLVGPVGRSVYIRAYARLLPVNDATTARVSVLDNTDFDAQWALAGPAFTAANSTTLTKNLNAGSGWTGTAYNNNLRIAATFAMLDTIYTGMQKIIAVDPNAVFPKLDVHWSPDNTTFSGTLASGQIGGSFFQSATTNGVVTSRDLYILGAANNDTDEYDQHVIAHEFGHYLQSAFSRNDSIGGSHGGTNDRLDMRVAFGEGWGNGWAGYALGNAIYADTAGGGQASGFTLDIAAGEASNPGWFKEASVQRIIWDLSKDTNIGFGSVWNALKTGFAGSPALTSAHSFANALRQNLTSSEAQTALSTIFNSESIVVATDPYGSNETNFGTPLILGINPIYTTYGALNSTTNACISNSADMNGVGNKAGQHRYIKLTLAAAGNKTITVTRDAATTAGIETDPDFTLYSSAGRVLRVANNTANTETATTPILPIGDYVLALTDKTFRTSTTARAPCFNVVIN